MTPSIGVLHRVVLGLHRQALFLGIDRGPARHRPTHQNAVDFEAQVPVQPARRMLLNDETACARGLGHRGWRGERLGGAPGVALLNPRATAAKAPAMAGRPRSTVRMPAVATAPAPM
jgi:hypothetical protein